MNSQTNTTDQARQREIGLLWLTAKTLVEINGTLTDIATLVQQQTDLLRRIIKERTK